jgi:hypothetical protein
MENELAERLRAICTALPEVTERPSHGAPTWFAGDKKSFVTLWADGHHDDHFPHLWCAAMPGAQAALIASDSTRYFRPPYVGGRGWLGVRLDRRVSRAELASLIEDAFRCVAPRTSLAALDAAPTGRAARPPSPERGRTASARRTFVRPSSG